MVGTGMCPGDPIRPLFLMRTKLWHLGSCHIVTNMYLACLHEYTYMTTTSSYITMGRGFKKSRVEYCLGRSYLAHTSNMKIGPNLAGKAGAFPRRLHCMEADDLTDLMVPCGTRLPCGYFSPRHFITDIDREARPGTLLTLLVLI